VRTASASERLRLRLSSAAPATPRWECQSRSRHTSVTRTRSAMSLGSFSNEGASVMIRRWTAAGVREAKRRFHRVAGYRAIPSLVAALRA
jgi:hypothetical protein